MDNNKRIEKIIDDNKVLVNNAKIGILNSKIKLVRDLQYCFFAIKFNEKDSKKLERFEREQAYILDSINKISEEDNLDRIIELRKKMNYYLSKMKKELELKKLSEDLIDNYQNSLNQYRKDVAKYIRYLKRNNNINEMQLLNNNISNLSDEEKTNLKKIIRREQNYNCKNLKVGNINKLCCNLSIKKDDSTRIKIASGLIDKENKTIGEFLDDRINTYKEKYHLRQIHNFDLYGGNCLKLVKNIPNYLKNKKIINVMKKDCLCFNRGKDFQGFIEYHKERNSIKDAIKAVINKHYRDSKRRRLIEDDKFCREWIERHYYKSEIEQEKQKTLSL